jgi:F-type H+-transporting ATPase subunit epsilon
MSPIRCEIVTQERLVFSEDVDMVTAPGAEGEMGILPHHAPLLTALTVGELRIKRGGVEEYFAVGGGFMEVQPDKVTVLADSAERSEEIDAARAEQARRRAEELLKGERPDVSTAALLEHSLRKAQARLRVARRRRGMRGSYEG